MLLNAFIVILFTSYKSANSLTPSFVTCDDLRKNIRINFQLNILFTTRMRSLLIFYKKVSHKFSRQSFHSQFLPENSFSRDPWYTSHINKFVNCSAMILQHQLINFPDVSIHSGDKLSPWMRFVLKQQPTILKQLKLLVNLCQDFFTFPLYNQRKYYNFM